MKNTMHELYDFNPAKNSCFLSAVGTAHFALFQISMMFLEWGLKDAPPELVSREHKWGFFLFTFEGILGVICFIGESHYLDLLLLRFFFFSLFSPSFFFSPFSLEILYLFGTCALLLLTIHKITVQAYPHNSAHCCSLPIISSENRSPCYTETPYFHVVLYEYPDFYLTKRCLK